MKTGQTVTYHAGDGGHEEAVVLAVTGAGASGFKVLDLTTVRGKTLTGIVHLRDRETGLGFWAFPEEAISEEAHETFVARPSLRRRRPEA